MIYWNLENRSNFKSCLFWFELVQNLGLISKRVDKKKKGRISRKGVVQRGKHRVLDLRITSDIIRVNVDPVQMSCSETKFESFPIQISKRWSLIQFDIILFVMVSIENKHNVTWNQNGICIFVLIRVFQCSLTV